MVLEALASAVLAGAPTQPRVGAPIGVLVIPRLHLRAVVHQGIAASVLAGGPGHYPGSALPGATGTVAVAGHRVTHTRPFLRITSLRKNDRIYFITPRHRFVYRVSAERIVPPRDIWVLRPARRQRLVLTACHPPRTAARRYVVFAVRVA
ncbi:MAG: class E sortase [Gaiellaceae bacterium]